MMGALISGFAPLEQEEVSSRLIGKRINETGGVIYSNWVIGFSVHF